MRILITIQLTISFLIACSGPQDKSVVKSEIQIQIAKDTCLFSSPDTSVSGIKIRNVESVLSTLGKQAKLRGDTSYLFYSKTKNQQLTLTVHPGDLYNQVSIFKVSYSHSSREQFPVINLEEFETEKGIRLGMTKAEIIQRLGTCHVSINNDAILQYELIIPSDSETKLLANHNMPIYYATYKFAAGKLNTFEFGFEYP